MTKKKATKKKEEVNEHVLTGIIPETWTEKLLTFDNHNVIVVNGEHVSDGEWSEIFNKIRNHFGEKFMEVYSHTSNGVHFDVFFKKV